MTNIRPAQRASRLGVVLAATALTTSLAACGADNEDTNNSAEDEGSTPTTTSELSGRIAGAGASSQAAAMDARIAGFTDENPDVTISYEPVGSGAGREQFGAGAVAFGGTDAALSAEELATAEQVCGQVVEVPLYVSPIAVVYNLPDVEDLQLSPQTIAAIFNQKITNWNDEAIAEDNPDADLPDLAITPVNRSDESGTTENFVDYLSTAAPEDWPYEVSGDWPVDGGEAAQGTSGVIGAVEAGEGTIGYADASQAGDLGVVAVGVGDEFVGPSPEAAAKILEASDRVGDSNGSQGSDTSTEDTDSEDTASPSPTDSEDTASPSPTDSEDTASPSPTDSEDTASPSAEASGDDNAPDVGTGEYIYAYDLARDTTESGTYPIVLLSYNLACTDYDDAETGEVVKAFFKYMASQQGQQAATDAAGSAPISDALRETLQPAIDAIGQG